MLYDFSFYKKNLKDDGEIKRKLKLWNNFMCDVDFFIVGVKYNVLEEEWLIFSLNTLL